MLIAGGAVTAISLSVLGYYGLRLIENVEAGEKYMVEPNDSLPIKENIFNATLGAYVVSYADFEGEKPMVSIRDPANQLVLEKTLEQSITLEAFSAPDDGTYTLTITNPSSDEVLEASVLFGEQQSVLSKADVSSVVVTAAFSFLLIAGAAAAVAGAVIMVFDKRRIGKMKQFGDTSDLV